jgi:hypothetical protein
MDTVFFTCDFQIAKPLYVKSTVAGGQVSCQEMLVVLMMSIEKRVIDRDGVRVLKNRFLHFDILWLERAKKKAKKLMRRSIRYSLS